MKKGLVEIVLVLDRSGSMANTKTDAEGGLREFIGKQRLLPGDARLTFYRFDNEIEKVFEDKALNAVELAELKLEPRGSTALLDAMNRAIDEVGVRLEKHAEDARPEQVYFVTITDGYENASGTPSKTVFDKVTTQRDKFGWQFIFIGANQDAIASAAKLGIDAGSTLQYSASRVGTQNLYKGFTEAVTRARTTGLDVSFTSQERSSALQEQ